MEVYIGACGGLYCAHCGAPAEEAGGRLTCSVAGSAHFEHSWVHDEQREEVKQR